MKSHGGRRVVSVPPHLLDWLSRHRDTQTAERDKAGTEWQDDEWMFSQPTGKPIDPRRDYDE